MEGLLGTFLEGDLGIGTTVGATCLPACLPAPASWLNIRSSLLHTVSPYQPLRSQGRALVTWPKPISNLLPSPSLPSRLSKLRFQERTYVHVPKPMTTVTPAQPDTPKHTCSLQNCQSHSQHLPRPVHTTHTHSNTHTYKPTGIILVCVCQNPYLQCLGM